MWAESYILEPSCGREALGEAPGQAKVGVKVRIEFIVAGNHPSMAKSKFKTRDCLLRFLFSP